MSAASPRESLARTIRRPARLRRRSGAGQQRGVALVLVLLLLSLITAMSVGMVLSVGSDMMINGYYRNYRGSFYAADSGLNIARQELVNQVNAAVPSGAAWAIPPIANPTALAASVQNYVASTYSGSTALNAGEAGNSWKESFKITNVSFALASGSPVVTSWNNDVNPPQQTGYQYIFNYSLTAVGASLGSEQTAVTENGSVTFDLDGQSGTYTRSFAAYGGFIDQYPPCLGPLVPGTMTGPMFTNGAWQFTTGGSYIFTDPVGQANANADFWFGRNCIQSPTSSYKKGNQTINPTFQGGFNLGQPTVPLPTNNFSQERAVLDGLGTNDTVPTSTDLHNALKDVAGAAYPASGSTSGVFLAYSSVNGANVMNGGGIYVEGDATVELSPSGSSAQVFTIGQGSTTTTVTVDPQATPPIGWNCPAGTTGTTVIQSGTTTTDICSVPKNNMDNHPATMLFVDGAINSLHGPGQGQGAIQDGAAITITAKNDITATGDVLYKTEPVTTTQNQIVPGTNPPCCNGSPVDTLIPGADHGQVLGIFTLTGNFNLNNSQSNKNIEVDGSIATISQGGTGGFLNTGSCINTFNNVGGQIQNSIYSACMSTQNVYFDRRFTNDPNFAPPWFPSTTVQQGGSQPTNVVSTVQRVRWVTTPQ